MWRRSVLGIALATSALLAVAVPAAAGNWAVTTLDTLPSEGFRAGETYRLGYTIRQHGQTPFAGAKTGIRIRSATDGADHTFGAVPEGAIGHYVAEVRFPRAGEWSWEVIQAPFEPQKLGTISVGPAPAPDRPPVSASLVERGSADLTVLWIALPVATLLAVALFAHRLVMFARQRRSVTDLRVRRVTSGSE